MTQEKIHRYNGNGQDHVTDLPKLVIITKHINDVALEHIKQNTRLFFEKDGWGNYVAQPTSSNQIVTLLLTYNYKTQYHNNATNKNTLFLKGDHHVGFEVDSICYDCCVHNRINTNGLEPGDRLAA